MAATIDPVALLAAIVLPYVSRPIAPNDWKQAVTIALAIQQEATAQEAAAATAASSSTTSSTTK